MEPELGKVTAYIGRKVTDGNYGSFDAGMWLTLPVGASQSDVDAGIATWMMMTESMKPAVLDRTKKRDANGS